MSTVDSRWALGHVSLFGIVGGEPKVAGRTWLWSLVHRGYVPLPVSLPLHPLNPLSDGPRPPLGVWSGDSPGGHCDSGIAESGEGEGGLARAVLPTAGSVAAILCLPSVRPPSSAQARPWRREVPASTRCDAPGRRRRARGSSPLGWPCGGRGRLRPHFSAFPNCGRREGAGRAAESVRLRSSRGVSGRCGCCGLGPGKDRVGSRVLILSARDLS